MEQFNKTRLAPTPSGYLHLGNILSFKITTDLARQSGAKILLRIDDLDRARINQQYVQDLFDTLNYLEICWEEGPRDLADYENNWSQIHRLANYQAALNQLKDSGEVFACRCSRTQVQACDCFTQNIPLDAKEVSWRLRTDHDREIAIKTLYSGIVKTTLPAAMKDFVVRKKDGYPAYQLTSLVDDIHYGTDLIIRGEDLWDSTVAQHYLALSLNNTDFQQITFHHHPLLMESAGKKLSKSAGATSIKYLRERGKTPDEIYTEIQRMSANGDYRVS